VKLRALVTLALAVAVVAPPSIAAAAEQAKGPRITAEPLVFDFGRALQKKTLHKDFIIKNFGTDDLEIERVSTTCGCTAALIDNKIVKPGQKAVLRVSLDTRTAAGRIERKILVQSNDPVKNPLELKVQATVVAGE